MNNISIVYKASIVPKLKNYTSIYINTNIQTKGFNKEIKMVNIDNIINDLLGFTRQRHQHLWVGRIEK